MCGFFLWPVLSGPSPGARPLPEGVLTIGPAFAGSDLAPEIGMLLPGARDDRTLLAAARDTPDLFADRGVGLFLADPYLNVPLAVRELRAAGLGWVAALPSVVQHEPDFRRYLQEVDLDHARELRALAAFAAAGFATLAAVATPDDARRAAAAGPDQCLALPDLGRYADGPPDLATRAHLEAELAPAGLPNAETGLLGLRTAEEPRDTLSGALGRPRPTD